MLTFADFNERHILALFYGKTGFCKAGIVTIIFELFVEAGFDFLRLGNILFLRLFFIFLVNDGEILFIFSRIETSGKI